MQIRNVYYATQPDLVIIRENSEKAIVELPVNVTKIETEDRSEWLAESVFYIETKPTEDLRTRVLSNYDYWLEIARIPEPQQATLSDVIDALNTLTDIVLGGDI